MTEVAATLIGTGTPPSPRRTQGVVVGETLYVIGGKCSNAGLCSDPYWAIRCGAGCASVTAEPLTFSGTSPISARDRAAVATDGKRYIWVHGGAAGSPEMEANLDQFDLQTMTITNLASSPFIREGHCMVHYNNALWGTQGFGQDLNTFAGAITSIVTRNDLWKYDLGTASWTPIVIPSDAARGPLGGEYCVCTRFDSRFFVYGGRGDGGGYYTYGTGRLGYADLASPSPKWVDLLASSDASSFGRPVARAIAWHWNPDPWTWVIYGGTDATACCTVPLSDMRNAWAFRPLCEPARAPWAPAPIAAGPATVLPSTYGGASGFLPTAGAAVLFGGLTQENGYGTVSGKIFVVQGAVPWKCAGVELSNAAVLLAGNSSIQLG